jgi:hypothetical protein
MLRKYQARKIGKEIRKATGLPLPVCQRAGNLIVRDRAIEMLSLPMFSGHIEVTVFPCGMDCCGVDGHVLSGPKGSYRFV